MSTPTTRMIKGGFAGYIFFDKDGTVHYGFVESDALRMVLNAKIDGGDGEELFGGVAVKGTDAKIVGKLDIGGLLDSVAEAAVDVFCERIGEDG